jgi:hypothetical protein
MKAKHYARFAGRLLAGGAAFAAASYATYAGITWYRYGRTEHKVNGEESDSLLDLYLPEYEVADRHHIRVAAPAETTFAAVCEMNMSQSAIVRAIFKTRELALGCAAAMAKGEFATCSQTNSQQQETKQQKEFLSEMKALGWGVLAEIPAREIVLGAVTQPWVAKPVFRAVRPEEFAAFQEPGYVKIVFTLRADPLNPSESMARTETRVATTDPVARARFRRYWALVSPGVILIRRGLLRSVKTEAERRTRELKTEYETAEFGQYTE